MSVSGKIIKLVAPLLRSKELERHDAILKKYTLPDPRTMPRQHARKA